MNIREITTETSFHWTNRESAYTTGTFTNVRSMVHVHITAHTDTYINNRHPHKTTTTINILITWSQLTAISTNNETELL